MTHVEIGDPGETIASYASAHGCDEIVMGTGGIGTIGNLLVGSVATKVIQLANMPVMLVK